jgi:4-hydroxymandelate oxidase
MSDENPAGFSTLSDLEAAARPKVIDPVWGYVSGGAAAEVTLGANREAFARWAIRPRALADTQSVELSTTMLGERVAAPFFVAPTAYQGLLHPEGEVATAKAASDAQLLFMLSTLSTCSLEEVAEAAPKGPRWFQLYLQPDFATTEELVHRAEKAGYRALVVTVDVPVLGIRDHQAQGGIALDSEIPLGDGEHITTPARGSAFEGGRYVLRPHAAVTPELLDRLNAISSLPLVVKGILTAEDAHLAVQHGAKAIVVSNHGGRQLDGTPAALDALPEVVGAVGTKAEVYMDSGVRRGSDVLMALALGARAVGLGRPVLWSLAAGGQPGVAHLFDLMKKELANVMAIAGRRSVAEIDRGLVRPRGPGPGA